LTFVAEKHILAQVLETDRFSDGRMAGTSIGFAFFLGLFLVVIGCGGSSHGDGADYVSLKKLEAADSVVITLRGEKGKSVLEITREHYPVGSKDSPMGTFVYMIDSLETGSDCGWIYSVNDVPGQVAADRYITSDSDIIKWHYRKY
jgi:hypothetical protein